MSLLRRAHFLGLLAVVGVLAVLSGCGGSASTPQTTPIVTQPGGYDQLQYSMAYSQAISGFLSASSQNKVQALMFPVLTPSNQNYTSFMTNILPNISGVSVSMQWSQIESTNGAGTGSGGYDFSAFDDSIAPYLAAKGAGGQPAQVNLIVWPATEGGSNAPGNGGSTPAYIFTSQWATNCCGTGPLDMAVCGSYTGDSSNPFYSQATSGSGGSWNINTSSDLSGLPVSYEAPFVVGFQNFIQAVIAHYNAPGAPKIGYIRFGFSQGGEDSPECNQYWPAPDGTPLSYTATEYLSYVQTMTNFVAAQNPSINILADLHAVGPPGSVDYSYADAEAADAVADGFGFGTNGLQKSDASASASQPCDSDWCNLFSMYKGTIENGKPITLSLQTLQWSDPTGVAQTGSLATINGGTEGLIPLAQADGANNLELYLADVALAYDFSNYCNYPHSQCN
jgi:hypothetical protein